MGSTIRHAASTASWRVNSRIALQRIADQALVRLHLLALLVVHESSTSAPTMAGPGTFACAPSAIAMRSGPRRKRK
jgi:hypothetical protein